MEQNTRPILRAPHNAMLLLQSLERALPFERSMTSEMIEQSLMDPRLIDNVKEQKLNLFRTIFPRVHSTQMVREGDHMALQIGFIVGETHRYHFLISFYLPDFFHNLEFSHTMWRLHNLNGMFTRTTRLRMRGPNLYLGLRYTIIEQLATLLFAYYKIRSSELPTGGLYFLQQPGYWGLQGNQIDAAGREAHVLDEQAERPVGPDVEVDQDADDEFAPDNLFERDFPEELVQHRVISIEDGTWDAGSPVGTPRSEGEIEREYTQLTRGNGDQEARRETLRNGSYENDEVDDQELSDGDGYDELANRLENLVRRLMEGNRARLRAFTLRNDP